MKTKFFFSMLTLLVLAMTGVAGEVTKDQVVTEDSFEGKLVCLSCDLKKTEGANAACSVYGHEHALKKADGSYISLLENDYSKDLIKGEKYHNMDVSLTGVYHKSANVLDVKTFTVDGKKKSWCNHCKAMDGCASKGHGEM